ncbi:MAG: NAD(P)H-binding protein [Alphaproteobacteria bacterium]|nr:NAD(P)H-binding protein [Alphaproteobacteria bacterium]
MAPRLRFKKAAIVGATGPTGIHLAAALADAKTGLRVISRNSARLAATFPDQAFEKRAADAVDAAAIAAAVEGCDLVVDCIGLPGEAMHLHEVTARNIAHAATAAGARLLQVSSYWAYLPLRGEVINEDHPRSGGGPYIRARRAAEDAMLEAGAAVLNLPDFYGPHVAVGPLTEALKALARGKPMMWIGPDDLAREHVYVPDAMAVAARVAVEPDAYGHRWVVPGAGPVTARALADHAGDHLGHKVRLITAGPMMLRLVSLFNRELRGFMQMVPEYLKPVRYDGTRLEALIGKSPVTPYAEGVAATLVWLAGR